MVWKEKIDSGGSIDFLDKQRSGLRTVFINNDFLRGEQRQWAVLGGSSLPPGIH